MKWGDLSVEPVFLAALDATDSIATTKNGTVRVPRSVAVAGGRPERHAWSNTFADQCARMVARAVRDNDILGSYTVLPSADGAAEPIGFEVGGSSKRVDVAALHPLFGLRVGISLKGLNFRDSSGRNFDKNLTGRTYELEAETLVLHRHLPMSFVVGLYFLPVLSTGDKRSERSESSFARTVTHLRKRVGRLDSLLASQMGRLDMAAVALYVAGDEESDGEGRMYARDRLPRGVIRYFDVRHDPPRRGRPAVATTMSLDELVGVIATEYAALGSGEAVKWASPESDQ